VVKEFYAMLFYNIVMTLKDYLGIYAVWLKIKLKRNTKK
jgi:hypothetical protein